MTKINAIIIRPGEEPKKAQIDNDLKAYQKAVGGYIETIQLQDSCGPTGIIAIVNEEGRIKGLKPCGWLEYGAGEWLVGPVVFVRDSLDSDDFASLQDGDYEIIENCFGRYQNESD